MSLERKDVGAEKPSVTDVYLQTQDLHKVNCHTGDLGTPVVTVVTAGTVMSSYVRAPDVLVYSAARQTQVVLIKKSVNNNYNLHLI